MKNEFITFIGSVNHYYEIGINYIRNRGTFDFGTGLPAFCQMFRSFNYTK